MNTSIIKKMAMALSQELNLEEIVRIGTVYFLEEIGNCNVLVFLPLPSKDWTIAAHANLSMSAEKFTLISDLAGDKICESVAEMPSAKIFPSAEKVSEFFLKDVDFLDGEGEILTVGGCCNGECVIVFILFREIPFKNLKSSLDTIDGLAQSVADQIAKIIKIHNRHKPLTEGGYHPFSVEY